MFQTVGYKFNCLENIPRSLLQSLCILLSKNNMEDRWPPEYVWNPPGAWQSETTGVYLKMGPQNDTRGFPAFKSRWPINPSTCILKFFWSERTIIVQILEKKIKFFSVPIWSLRFLCCYRRCPGTQRSSRRIPLEGKSSQSASHRFF